MLIVLGQRHKSLPQCFYLVEMSVIAFICSSLYT